MHRLIGQDRDHQHHDAWKDFVFVNYRGRHYKPFRVNGGFKMGSRQTSEVMRLAVDENNVKAARECFHEEYMYVRELEMLSLDDALSHLKEDFASGKCSSTNRVTLYDDDRTNVFSHDVTYNEAIRGYQVGTIVPVRIVSLKKDGLIWRAMISTS
mgnify:FL=1